MSVSWVFSRLLPERGICRFEKTQTGKGGGKALADTDWHWLFAPVPPLVLLGFRDFGQNHAAVQRKRHSVFLR